MQVISKGKNGEFKIKPLRIDSRLQFSETQSSDGEQSVTESPCFKK